MSIQPTEQKKTNNYIMEKMTHFEEEIKKHLDELASTDTLFAPLYCNASKSIAKCCTYIVDSVKKSGRSGFTDDEIYCMAVHYYTEENVKDGKSNSNVRVVINKSISPSNEKLSQIKEKPITKKKITKTANTIIQQSLFDDEL